MAYDLLFAQLPERHGAGGGNVQGIDPVGHGDLDRIIAGCDGGMGKAVSLRAQHNGKLRLPGKGFVINADRTVTQGHGSRLEAQGIQLGKPLSGQSAGVSPICAQGT